MSVPGTLLARGLRVTHTCHS